MRETHTSLAGTPSKTAHLWVGHSLVHQTEHLYVRHVQVCLTQLVKQNTHGWGTYKQAWYSRLNRTPIGHKQATHKPVSHSCMPCCKTRYFWLKYVWAHWTLQAKARYHRKWAQSQVTPDGRNHWLTMLNSLSRHKGYWVQMIGKTAIKKNWCG